MKLRILINVVLVAVVLYAASAVGRALVQFARKPAEADPMVVAAKVVAPPVSARHNERVRVVGYGSARPHMQVKIMPQVGGRVVFRCPDFWSGKFVRKGQLLLRIDPVDFQLRLDQARKHVELLDVQLKRLAQEEANLRDLLVIERDREALSAKEVARIAKLQRQSVATDTELDKAKEVLLARQSAIQQLSNQLNLIGPQRAQLDAERAQAEIERRQAELDLSRCEIVSPVDGQVVACAAQANELVAPNAACGEIYATEVMEVPVSVNAGDLEWIDLDSERVEAIVEWQPPNGAQKVTRTGYVERREAGLEPQTRTATLIARVHNPPAATQPDAGRATEENPPLEMNAFCKVTVLGRLLPSSFVLPRQAVLPDGTVYVSADGKLASRKITVARYTSDEALVLPGGGLNDGDRVVTSYVPKAVVGMPVEPIAQLTPAGGVEE